MLECLYAVPFKHFEDVSAVDTLALTQEVAEVGYGCSQVFKACGRFSETTEPFVVVAIVALLREIEHFGCSPNDVRTSKNNVRLLVARQQE
jgi:hypothetical protein